MKYYGATDRTLAAIDADGNILFLALRTGRFTGGNQNVAYVWTEFERTPGIDLDGAIAATASRLGMDTGELHAQMVRPVRVLRSGGVLTTRPPGSPAARVTAIRADEAAQPAQREAADAGATVPMRVLIAGATGLAIALVLTRLPFWVQLEILMAIRRRRPQRPGLPQTRRLAAAVKRAARRFPGRTECMEQSQAVFIAGALVLGAAPDWCHGSSLLTDTYHAFVQAGDTAIDYTNQYGRGGSLITMIRL
jgi:hypothetical protein